METKRRVGIVGFGKLGQYLYEEIGRQSDMEVVFVWNRTPERMKGIMPDELTLKNLDDCGSRSPDIIVEVCHPQILAQHGVKFLRVADLLVGSPTALADEGVYQALMKEARQSHCLYVASGAFWGAQDIQKMADRGTLKGLKVIMRKHPSAFKVSGELITILESVQDEPVTLYKGPVRGLCPLAPNNVNTMACAAIAAHNLGFDGVVGCLVADPSHIVEIEVEGPGSLESKFSVHTVRKNPSATGVVTGKQTFGSFLSSLTYAKGRACGVQIC